MRKGCTLDNNLNFISDAYLPIQKLRINPKFNLNVVKEAYLKDNVTVMVIWHAKSSFFCFGKRLTRGLYIAVILLDVSFSAVRAESISNKSPLSLDEALRLSIEFHPLISAKQNEYEAAQGELASARWSAFPNPSFSFREFQNNGSQNARKQETLSISQPLWTGGRLSGGIDLAKARRDASKMAIIEAEQEILGETAKSFLEFHQSQLKLEIFKSNVAEHERLFKMIERRVEASTSPEVDLKLARARLAFSRSQLLRQTNAIEAFRSSLQQLVGRPVFEILAPQYSNLKRESLEEAEKQAMAFSPKIRKVRAEIAALEASKKVSKSLLYPQVSIGYEKNFGELSSGQEPEQGFLGLDFQPGAGLSARSSIRVSRAKQQALQDSLEALQREIYREVQITYREFLSAEMQLSPTRLLVDSTSDVVASYLRQYTVGRKSWLDVLNAQRELVQARQSLVDNQAMLSIASFRLKILIGELTSKTVRGRSG